jgi:ATP-dependent DNA helicase RecQ
MSEELNAALNRHFGFKSFRVGQLAIINAIMNGQHVLGVMPTGAGKSLCFQLPALLQDGLTIVVSPLISLMKDQVDQLQQQNISATYINSSVSRTEREERLRDATKGRYQLIYVAPERFNTPFMEQLKTVEISQFVVDEAHCISQWGHDFRPDYMRLGDIARELGAKVICAFTATATAEVRADIIRLLGIPSDNTWIFGFHRANLRLDVVAVDSLRQKIVLLESYLRQRPQAAGIIYCATRKHVEKVSALLGPSGCGFAVERYHGGLDESERRHIQDRFMSGQSRIMVATNAFGMGVDRADLRFVIHFELPGSLEAYYQEAGRAGRDGEPAECTILFNYADTRTQNFFIERRSFPASMPEEMQRKLQSIEQARLRDMVRYCYSEICRHETVLEYFGESFEDAPCENCDRCIGHAALGDPAAILPSAPESSVTQQMPVRSVTDDEKTVLQKVLSAVARARGQATASVIADALIGSKSTRVIDSPLAGTRSHGLLRGWSRARLTRVITALVDAGCLKRSSQGRQRYLLTPLGTEVMWKRAAVSLAAPPFGHPDMLEEQALPHLDKTSAELFEQLRSERNEMARLLGVPTYVICQDATLVRIAMAKPATKDEMLEVKGVGPASEERFGKRFRALIGANPAHQ